MEKERGGAVIGYRPRSDLAALLLLASLLSLALLFSYCVSRSPISASSTPPPSQRGAPPFPAAVVEEVQLSGRRVLRYEHSSSPAWRYAETRAFIFSVILPAKPSTPAPLIVNLHSAGGGGEKELPESAYITRRSGGEFYGLSLNCYEFDWWWGKQDLERNAAYRREPTPVERRVLDTVRWVMSQYHIDRDRVYLIGRSMGGAGAFAVGMPHGDLFAAMHVTVPADESLLYPRLNLPVVRDAEGRPSLDRRTPDYLQRVSAAGYPDPPFLLDYFSHNDKFSRHHDVLLAVMREGRFGGIAAWGPFGHTADVHSVALAALEFPWLSIRRDQAYPAFTDATTNDTYPGFQGSGPDQYGQINAYLRWSTVADTAARFAMDIRIVSAFELSIMTRPPSGVTVDVTPRRLQRFRVEAGRTYTYSFGRGGAQVSRGTVVADAAGLVTVPRLSVTATPATLTLERQ